LAWGGIQLAQAAVPTAVNDGIDTGPGACVRWGYYSPFSVTELDQLYPTHDEYVDQVTRVAHHNVWQGYILEPDAQATIRCAIYSNVGGSDRDHERRHDREERHSQEDLYCKPYF
jgi:Alpha/beta hydrolase domain